MKMIMDEGEILIEYRSARDKKKQVEILADLNACDRKAMAQWLADHGEEVDKRLLGKAKPKPEPAAESVPAKENDMGGKEDAGKPRLTLVPMQILWDIARVREYGNKKYGAPDNWRGVDPQRFREAAFRHFLAYIDDPASVDEESGLPHRFHLECNLAFLAALEES